MDAEFCLLGPLLVRARGATLRTLPGKQRVLLATLLLQGNCMVAVDQLAEAIWGDKSPASADGTLRDYVKELRKQLAAIGESRIATVPGGYMFRIGPGELDVLSFEELRAQAMQAASDRAWARASDRWRAAELLWRGEPLADVPSELLRAREVPRLTEMRLQALESRIEADLQLGRHADVIADLRQLTVKHPLRERLHALLMLALYRDGQQAAAQAVFREVRAVLVEELGTEPVPELRRLHQQILAADPALDPPAPACGVRAAPQTAAGQPTAIVPRQLPAAVSHFTGRAAELEALTGMLSDASGTRTVVISALAGTAGVGKTAVAVHWAHQVAERFGDGQLYVNLRGYDPGQPVAAADALAGFLRALGVPGQEIPDEREERARLYRSRLAGRRVLVVLDNARDGEQVRPLLPGDPGCAAVVTSRDALAGLVAADGARRLDLDLLPLADAVGLLRSLIGPRAAHDPGATAELAGLCARLPLALRIAAELAAARRTTPLAVLVAELAAGRLDGLDAGEDRADVRAVLSWSYRQLPEDAAGAFALTGLHPGDDLDAHAAAALTGTTAGQARKVLGQLHRASLLQATGPGRYGMHDLLRAYAREQAAARDTGGCCRQALTGLFDYYLAAAAAAMDVLRPAEAHQRPRVNSIAAVVPDMADQAGARAWLDAERANLVAVVMHCAGHGWPDHAAGLARTLFRYLMNGSHLPEAHTIYGHALQAARRSGDLAAEADALNGLGGIGIMKGQFRDAVGHYQAALERYRRCADREGEARVLYSLGLTQLQLHNHREAAGYYREAMAAFADAGDSLGAARALAFLGGVEAELGSYDQAEQHLQHALPTFREEKDQVSEAETLSMIGYLSLRRGQLTQAADVYEQALALYRRLDYPAGAATQLSNLGEVSLRRGEYQQAIGYLRQALTLFRQAGDQHGETVTLRTLAEAMHGTGQPAAARAELETALRLAADTGNTYQQASAHRDLAESHHRAGQDQQARHHWQQALDLYTQLDAPEVDQVRTRLSAQHAEQAGPRAADGTGVARGRSQPARGAHLD
jgi:DNA-binding SARP family transcriptional activator/tetratricopeptide (TPR) repeat protein